MMQTFVKREFQIETAEEADAAFGVNSELALMCRAELRRSGKPVRYWWREPKVRSPRSEK